MLVRVLLSLLNIILFGWLIVYLALPNGVERAAVWSETTVMADMLHLGPGMTAALGEALGVGDWDVEREEPASTVILSYYVSNTTDELIGDMKLRLSGDADYFIFHDGQARVVDGVEGAFFFDLAGGDIAKLYVIPFLKPQAIGPKRLVSVRGETGIERNGSLSPDTTLYLVPGEGIQRIRFSYNKLVDGLLYPMVIGLIFLLSLGALLVTLAKATSPKLSIWLTSDAELKDAIKLLGHVKEGQPERYDYLLRKMANGPNK